MCTDYRLTEAQRTSHAELQWDSTQRWSSHYSDSHSSYLTTNHSAAVTPTAATIYTPLIIYLVLQAAENMSNTLIHLYLYFWPLKVQYVRLWSFWHHCTVLLMFFNDSVLSRLLFQCTDVVFRWVFFVGASQQLTWWSVWTQHEPRKDSQLTSSSLPISQPSCQTNQSFNPLSNTAAT